LINEQQIKLKSDLKELETRVYDQFERVDDKLKALEAKKKELENAAKDGAVDAIRKKFDF
jgi:predicted nuclease with TOPRIM domain